MSDNPNQNITPVAPPPATSNTYANGALRNTTQPIVIEQQSNGKGIAIGALVLALVALGASGVLFVQGQNTFEQQKLKVQQELDKASIGESENARKLANSLDEQAKLNQIVSQLDAGAQQNRNHIADVQRGYQELLKGRVNWLVDEVEVTLNLASQQLLLSGNVPVAITVLESIEQRLSRFEQSDLLPIKKAISADLAALKARPYLDVSGSVLKLDSLEKSVAALPLLVDSTLQASPTQEVATPNAADFWTRTWDKTMGVLKGMVEIRKLDSNDAMLLAPEQIYFVRSNLRLRLLDARLALLQHNGEVYKNNLDAIENTVKQYFDTQSPSTQKWLQDLNELKSLDIHMVSDEALKESQTAVRNYQNTTRTANPVNLAPIEPLASVTLGKNDTAKTVAPSVQAASTPPAPVNVETPKAAVEAPKADTASPVVVKPENASSAATPIVNAKPAEKPVEKPVEKSDNKKNKPDEKKSEPKKSEPKKSDEKKADSAGKPETSKQVELAFSTFAVRPITVAESVKAELVKPTSALQQTHVTADLPNVNKMVKPAVKKSPAQLDYVATPSKKTETLTQQKNEKAPKQNPIKAAQVNPNPRPSNPKNDVVNVAKNAPNKKVAPNTTTPNTTPNKIVATTPPKNNNVAAVPKTTAPTIVQNKPKSQPYEGFINPKDAARFANAEVVQPRPVINKIERLETFGGKRDPVLRDLDINKKL